MSKVLAICNECGKCKACGEECIGCKSNKDVTGGIVSYTNALKTAIACWQEAKCEEHSVPCKPTLKEFADKFVDLQKRISVLESAIRCHKELKTNVDELDKSLWDILNG